MCNTSLDALVSTHIFSSICIQFPLFLSFLNNMKPQDFFYFIICESIICPTKNTELDRTVCIYLNKSKKCVQLLLIELHLGFNTLSNDINNAIFGSKLLEKLEVTNFNMEYGISIQHD